MADVVSLECNSNWKSSIYEQLKDRDKKDSGSSRHLIAQLQSLADRCEAYRIENLQLNVQQLKLQNLSSSGSSDGATGSITRNDATMQQMEQKIYKLQEELTMLHRTKGDTAEQLVAVTNCLQERDREVTRLKHEIDEYKSEIMIIKEDCLLKKSQIEELATTNTLLKDEYTALNMTYSALEKKHFQLQAENAELIQRWIDYKARDAERLNEENDKVYKSQQREVQAALREASQDGRTVDLSSEPDFVVAGTWACPCAALPTNAFFEKDCHDSDINTMQLSSTGKMMATGGDDRKIKIFNMSRDGFTALHTLTGANAAVNDIVFSSDDSYVAGASSDSASRIWSIPDLRIRHTLTGHTGKIFANKFISDATKLITGSQDKTIKLWDLRSKACSQTFFVGSSCYDIAIPRGSDGVFFSGHFDKTLRVYDVRAKSSNSTPNTEVKLEDKITSVNMLNTMEYQCLVSCRDDTLKLLDVRKRAVITEYTAAGLHLGSDIARACVSPDDKYCAVGSGDGSIYIWNLTTGSLQNPLSGEHSSCIMSCKWTPDGQSFLSVERSKKVVVWCCI